MEVIFWLLKNALTKKVIFWLMLTFALKILLLVLASYISYFGKVVKDDLEKSVISFIGW